MSCLVILHLSLAARTKSALGSNSEGTGMPRTLLDRQGKTRNPLTAELWISPERSEAKAERKEIISFHFSKFPPAHDFLWVDQT